MQKLNSNHPQISIREIRAIICALLITIALAPVAIAQDPFAVAPKAYKLEIENDWTRVVRVRYEPFEKLPAHDHPKRQAIFIYLNDGGPVRFKHVEGVSGDYAATRPPTKAGAYRLAGIQPENHEVENLSDVPSLFLQVELKTEPLEPKTFRGRFFPEFALKQMAGNYRRVEFDNPQARITRLVCAASSHCDALELSSYPALLVALSPLQFKTIGDDASQLKLEPGQLKWLEPGRSFKWQNASDARAEQLLIEFKSKPAQSTGGAEKHKH